MEEIRRLREALEFALASRAHTEILIAGAGDCAECDLMQEICPDARLTLVEPDADCCEALRAKYPCAEEFICIRCCDLDKLPELVTRKYDFILARHPDCDRRKESWSKGWTVVSDLLHNEGVFVATCYSLSERNTLRYWSRLAGFEEMRGRFRSNEPVAITGSDRYILMYQLKT